MPCLAVKNATLWYERSGQGRPVLFLHAFAVTGATWFPQVPALAASGYGAICLDLRGHGRSSAPPAPYTLPQMAADVHQLIERLELDDVCLVGLSTGGRVAMRLALDYSKDIAALVLVSTKSEPAREIEAELQDLARIAERGGTRSAVEQWYDRHYQRLADAVPDLVQKMKEEWCDRPADGFIGVAQAITGMESMTVQLAEVCVPTLAIAGALDPSCQPYVAWYERTIPNCQGVIVPEAGHFVNLEQPERFNDLLQRFLACLSEQAPALVPRKPSM